MSFLDKLIPEEKRRSIQVAGSILIGASIWIGAIYVVIHFIVKYW